MSKTGYCAVRPFLTSLRKPHLPEVLRKIAARGRGANGSRPCAIVSHAAVGTSRYESTTTRQRLATRDQDAVRVGRRYAWRRASLVHAHPAERPERVFARRIAHVRVDG